MQTLFSKFDFISTYLDDILIHSASIEENKEHVKIVIKILQENGLFAKSSKCIFAAQKVEFLGHNVSYNKITPSDEKVKAVMSWNSPQSTKQVRTFVGFVTFYSRFIPKFSEKTAILIALMNDKEFSWTEEHQKAFEELRTILCSYPVLRVFDPDLPTRVETDCSTIAVGGVLLQLQKDDSRYHPVAY